jgi:hypothetical protein
MLDLVLRQHSGEALRCLLSDPRFPVNQENRLSESWFKVIVHCITSDNFLLFRQILSEWEPFRTQIDLANVPVLSFPFVDMVPAQLKPFTLLIYAIEKGRMEFAYLLLMRSWIFRYIGSKEFQNSRWGQQLLQQVPELADVHPDRFDPEQGMKIGEILLSSQDADKITGVICSSYWRAARDAQGQARFVQDALESGSRAHLLAAVRRGLLKYTNLLEIFSIPNFRELEFLRQLDQYLGIVDANKLMVDDGQSAMDAIQGYLDCSDEEIRSRAEKVINSLSHIGPLELLWKIEEIK